MKLTRTLAILGLVTMHVSRADIPPYLAALSQIESNGKDHKIGRAGERSQYQIKKSVWTDWQKLNKHLPFSQCKGKLATHCALHHTSWLRDRFFIAHNKFPSAAQFYCMWNMGWDGFAKHGFLVSACPRRVQERAERFANLVAALKEEGK